MSANFVEVQFNKVVEKGGNWHGNVEKVRESRSHVGTRGRQSTQHSRRGTSAFSAYLRLVDSSGILIGYMRRENGEGLSGSVIPGNSKSKWGVFR